MITIVDYGLGNIKAFENVYKRLNIETNRAKTEKELLAASKLILPGVGAFDHAMYLLNNSGLRECLDEMVLNRKVPVLGICVGMQMMAMASDEGISSGLGWVDGNVRSFAKAFESVGCEYPLPHMGWNNLITNHSSPILESLDSEKRFYFLHSYYFECHNESDIVASCEYGIRFPSIIQHKNVYGMQCHPEKSHHNGVHFLKNFAEV